MSLIWRCGSSLKVRARLLTLTVNLRVEGKTLPCSRYASSSTRAPFRERSQNRDSARENFLRRDGLKKLQSNYEEPFERQDFQVCSFSLVCMFAD